MWHECPTSGVLMCGHVSAQEHVAHNQLITSPLWPCCAPATADAQQGHAAALQQVQDLQEAFDTALTELDIARSLLAGQRQQGAGEAASPAQGQQQQSAFLQQRIMAFPVALAAAAPAVQVRWSAQQQGLRVYGAGSANGGLLCASISICLAIQSSASPPRFAGSSSLRRPLPAGAAGRQRADATHPRQQQQQQAGRPRHGVPRRLRARGPSSSWPGCQQGPARGPVLAHHPAANANHSPHLLPWQRRLCPTHGGRRQQPPANPRGQHLRRRRRELAAHQQCSPPSPAGATPMPRACAFPPRLCGQPSTTSRGRAQPRAGSGEPAAPAPGGLVGELLGG